MSARVSEASGFLEAASGAALYVRHYLPDEVRGPVVMLVGPDGEERIWSQRTMVNLARYLARAGSPVVRFDFRGQGESDGNYEETDALSRVDDVALVADWIGQASPVPPVLIGVRLGANVAARYLRSRTEAGRLIAIEPMHPVGPVIDELLRKNVAHQYLVHKKLLHTRPQLLQQIRDGGTVTCSGFLLGPPLAFSIQELDWLPDTIPAAWSVLKLGEYGGEGESIPDIAPFWKDGPTYRSCPVSLFNRVAELVVQASGTRLGVRDTLATLAPRAPDGRETITFDTPQGIAVGTWHPANGHGVVALITNAGPNDRSSPHGLAHRLARFFQSRGVPALRIDGRGAGESAGDDEARQNRPTPDVHREINSGDHVPAARAALAWLRAQGARKVIMTGLCGGAVNAMLAAGSERDLEFRMVPLGIPVLHLGALEEVEFPEEVMRDEFTRLKMKLLRPSAILRFLTFRTDYRVFWLILRSRLGQFFQGRPGAQAPPTLHPNAIGPMIESWQALSRRGTRTTFVFASFDLLYVLFLKHFPPLANGGALPAGSDILVIEKANHILSDRSSEAQLVAFLDQVVEEAFAGARSPTGRRVRNGA